MYQEIYNLGFGCFWVLFLVCLCLFFILSFLVLYWNDLLSFLTLPKFAAYTSIEQGYFKSHNCRQTGAILFEKFFFLLIIRLLMY